MAKKYQLGWDKNSRRWYKRYKKRLYWFPAKKGESKEASYKRCWQDWLAKKEAIDSAQASPQIARLREILAEAEAAKEQFQTMEENGIISEHARQSVEWEIQRIRKEIAAGGVPQSQPTFAWQVQTTEAPDVETSIGGNVEQFLLQKRGEAERGEISIGRYDTLRRCAEHFRDWAGKKTDITTLNGATLIGYHAEIQTRVSKKEFSTAYAKDYWAICKQFFRWLYQQEKIDSLPRNFDDKSLKIRVGAKAVETFTMKEVRTLLANSSEITKLYWLLMLNCGMTQVDISNLRHDQVDWRKKRIRRKRSKTEDWENVPVTDCPLWPETYKLLAKFRSDHPERVLVNEKGKALKREWLREDGKMTKVDNIRTACVRVFVKLKADKKPLKLIRNTSASLLDAEYGRQISQHFLGHSPRSIAEKHYIAPDQGKFDNAITWLGEQFLGD